MRNTKQRRANINKRFKEDAPSGRQPRRRGNKIVLLAPDKHSVQIKNNEKRLNRNHSLGSLLRESYEIC